MPIKSISFITYYFVSEDILLVVLDTEATDVVVGSKVLAGTVEIVLEGSSRCPIAPAKTVGATRIARPRVLNSIL